MLTYESLIAEGNSVPVDGWDFTWFEGRATEQRPSWHYQHLIANRLATARSALDLQTGGGEVLAGALHLAAPTPAPGGSGPSAAPTIPAASVATPTTAIPAYLAATESWAPNLDLARRNLAPYGAEVFQVADHEPLPFADSTFDLVLSRHPVVTIWPEIARVLTPGGTYLSQQVGAGSVHQLTDFMMGEQPIGPERTPSYAVERAQAAGLEIVDVQFESLRTEFFDIAAVVHFLRKVIWIVPGFTVEQYADRLRALHEQIQTDGPFVASTERFLIEARKPATSAG